MKGYRIATRFLHRERYDIMTSTFDHEPKIIRLSVSGMRCAGCVEAVETALRRVPNVFSADVNFADHSALVRGDVEPEVLRKAVQDAGYDAAVMEGLEDPAEQEAWKPPVTRRAQQGRVAGSVGGPLMLVEHFGLFPMLGEPTAAGIWLIVSMVTRGFFIIQAGTFQGR